MNPTASLQGLEREELLAAFVDQCANAAQVQEQVLLDIVNRARDAEWGQAHDFANIRSIAEFRARVGVTQWSDMEPYALRMQNGEPDLIFPGLAEMFIITSGTTGSVKLIPESSMGTDVKRVTQDARIAAVLPHLPELAESGYILTFANRRYFGTTEAGIPYGAASGSNLAQAPPLGAQRLAYPLWVPEVADGEGELDYLILRFALERDVRAIRGNNAGRLIALLKSADAMRDRLINDIRHGVVTASSPIDPALLEEEGLAPNPDRADELTAAIAQRGRLDAVAAWPNLGVLVFWLSGSVGRYMNDLGDLVASDVMRWDIGYGASEGRFTIPLVPDDSSGPLALYAAFYEFQPLDGGEPLLAHEVEVGQTYALIVTTYSGLYRYDMHDLVKVEGFTGTTPNIVFEAKSGDVGNIAQEKIPGAAALQSVGAMLSSAGVQAQHFALIPDLDRHGYDLCVELAPGSSELPGDIALRFEQALCEATLAYEVVRGTGVLAPARVLLMATGWQEALYADQMGPGRSRSQVKLRTFEPTVPHPEMIEGVIESANGENPR